jgi:hypothetical protein
MGIRALFLYRKMSLTSVSRKPFCYLLRAQKVGGGLRIHS